MPTTVREVLDSLPPPERARLLYAFEHQIPQHIVLPDNRYIGVYVKQIRNLIPEAFAGDWSIGRIQNLVVVASG